ncbi:alpha/beta fold hydrolase [Tuwongella immobilis]|uniref:AB hydrolase-1 domain-containing protein n=1 Tax=Tuwongella immobilis TaxID=692036 RepID=A0A6C2YLY9_9BACT|nr:alpha/beta hydrolase [Tuwongella immobilis]VIP02331.1 Putative hydrolase or acyltransferase of alpha/beta superfamily OS=Singulisphaera acidiphila (strain ATCC BAA-1392 / DSM 18658 / VKM B-2454 / MOB10) GN=Sinac_1411 PE=4 SV=1: Abhydrolase_6 [Tuwongella immobilis]VTS01079.1 Putative hydrolase or acyltransferase of alpha/beta superfamily OS=Singulisphaera acidiphila (strain ATCC BAA-1392 / DSM 18658 / VKM B-2454 / MOB10) GN=Sinac_1411 PE=4 SV=1: Abhydrolase_6 [Tuwongella immobilis]
MSDFRPEVEPDSLAAAVRACQQMARKGVVDTGRYRLRYLAWGDSGPAIVFIHGLSDSAISFAGVMAALRDRYRCIAYELPDGKADGAPLIRYQHTDLVSDLLALMDELAIDRASILGSSFGSTVALRALAEAPKRFPVGMLQGGFAYRPLHPLERLAAQIARYLPWRMRDLPMIEQSQQFVDWPTFRNGSPEAWNLFRVSSRTPRAESVARRALLLHSNDLRPLLPRIQQPVLMIRGEADRVIPPEVEATALDALPNVTQTMMPGCGHYPQYLQPRQMADAMHAFLVAHAGILSTGATR